MNALDRLADPRMATRCCLLQTRSNELTISQRAAAQTHTIFHVEGIMKRPIEEPSPVRQESIVERLAIEAIGLGADELAIEYKDGAELAFAVKAEVGFSIASFRSSSRQAGALRDELHRLAKGEAANRRGRWTQVPATTPQLRQFRRRGLSSRSAARLSSVVEEADLSSEQVHRRRRAGGGRHGVHWLCAQ
jgi:hypothetical protein